MFMKDTKTGHLVEVLDQEQLHDPFATRITGRLHYGEEMQEPEQFEKTGLAFQSGEALPACWTDPHYRDDELRKTG